MQRPKTRDIIAYATLPRVVPRVRNFFSSGFGYIAFLMAHVYSMVRLLPPGHPYLSAANMGRFGIVHVMAEAGRNLTLKKENIDQIIIYMATIAGAVMLVMQFVILIYAGLTNMAHAQVFSFFDTPDPARDVAYTILDYVFGIPDMFCSSFNPGNCTDTNPVAVSPYHEALHDLFTFYTTGILLIGVLIFLYFCIVIVAETAVTGTPFGQRFQNVWVPVRLVVAVGLLVPITYGLNSGQWIVLYTAKYASSFATVGWNDFQAGIVSHSIFSGTLGNPIGERYSLLAIPSQVDVTPVVEAMSQIHACAYAYMRITAGSFGTTGFYTINQDYTSSGTDFMIKPYLVKNAVNWIVGGGSSFPVPVNPAQRVEVTGAGSPSYDQAVGFYYGGDIIIRFGEYRPDPLGTGGTAGGGGASLVDLGVYQDELGGVKPYCGDIRIPVTDLNYIDQPDTYGGSPYMIRFFYELILDMWFNDQEMKHFARAYVTVNKGNEPEIAYVCGSSALSGCGAHTGFPPCGTGTGQCGTTLPSTQWKTERTTFYQQQVDDAVRAAWALYIQNSLLMFLDNDLIELGWGGAGIWYNRIAEMNGAFANAVSAKPFMDRYPLVMEQVRKEKLKLDKDVTGTEQWKPSVSAKSGKDAPNLKIGEGDDGLQQIAQPLYDVAVYWNGDQKDQRNEEEVTFANIFMDAMQLLLGTSGLDAMRGANAHLHPLAQLVAVGKGLVDAAVRNMAISSASAFMGGAISAFQGQNGNSAVLTAVSKMFLSVAFIGLTAGFVLFYVLPFLPFLYFFFAIASWVKAIFEAMVGVPLWALAHIRIDGEGLPGDAASNGYFLLLEIAIRPILTVFGLIASVTIFAAQVRVLNLIWDLVTANATGFTDTDMFASTLPQDMEFKRSVVDQFFFTIIYTVICYMLGLASFKLIDTIPDNILRWAGASVSAFGDINQDNVSGVTRMAAVGGMTIGQQAAGAIQGASQGMGASLGRLVAGNQKT